MLEDMYVPSVGEAVPRFGNRLTRSIGRLLLVVCRWRIEGRLPDASKFVIALAPHTSSWDFVTNMGTMIAMGFRSSWLIADAYDWWPLGYFIRRLGGIPIDRSVPHDLVSRMVRRFRESDAFILAIFPEGTRRRVREWKTGFWHIAAGAGVSIQLVAVDYEKRATLFGPLIEPSGDIEADMAKIRDYFRGVRGKRPDLFDQEYR